MKNKLIIFILCLSYMPFSCMALVNDINYKEGVASNGNMVIQPFDRYATGSHIQARERIQGELPITRAGVQPEKEIQKNETLNEAFVH